MASLQWGFMHNEAKIQRASMRAVRELFAEHLRQPMLQKQQAMTSNLMQNLIQLTLLALFDASLHEEVLLDASGLLLALLIADQAAWHRSVARMVEDHDDEHQHLKRAFDSLLVGVEPRLTNENVEVFMQHVKLLVVTGRRLL